MLLCMCAYSITVSPKFTYLLCLFFLPWYPITRQNFLFCCPSFLCISLCLFKQQTTLRLNLLEHNPAVPDEVSINFFTC